MVHPRLGTSIGEGTVPPCSGWETPTSGDRIVMREVEGVSPDIAVAQDGIPEVIYLREDVREPPPQLASYFTAPTCDPALAPIRLQGTWLGILGADGQTELDLLPPYDIELLVTRSSPSGYERADLTVRVPPSLGQPLSHTDIEDSLWTGGEIDVIATCVGERFLATGVFVPAVNSAQS